MARSAKSKITGIEMFHKSLEEGHAGDQVRNGVHFLP